MEDVLIFPKEKVGFFGLVQMNLYLYFPKCTRYFPGNLEVIISLVEETGGDVCCGSN